jgi:hypothetical protein
MLVSLFILALGASVASIANNSSYGAPTPENGLHRVSIPRRKVTTASGEARLDIMVASAHRIQKFVSYLSRTSRLTLLVAVNSAADSPRTRETRATSILMHSVPTRA